MKRVTSAFVFVVAVLALHQCSMAQGVSSIRSVPLQSLPPIYDPQPLSNLDPLPAGSSLAKFSMRRTGEAVLPEGAFNGFISHRLQADLGAPGSAGNGFHHFSMPMDKYTNWYRPRAATLTQYQRCAPDSFRPRGLGHLFARPCDGYRMEYEPYVLSDGMSSYGPSYIARLPDPRCDHCDHCNSDDCDECQNRKCR